MNRDQRSASLEGLVGLKNCDRPSGCFLLVPWVKRRYVVGIGRVKYGADFLGVFRDNRVKPWSQRAVRVRCPATRGSCDGPPSRPHSGGPGRLRHRRDGAPPPPPDTGGRPRDPGDRAPAPEHPPHSGDLGVRLVVFMVARDPGGSPAFAGRRSSMSWTSMPSVVPVAARSAVSPLALGGVRSTPALGSRCLSCGMRWVRGRLAHLLLGTVSFGHGCGAGMPCCGSCAAGASTSRKTAWNRNHRSHRIRVTRRNCVTRRWWWRLWWGSGHVPTGAAHRSTSRSRWGSWQRVWRPAPSSGRRRGSLSSGTR